MGRPGRIRKIGIALGAPNQRFGSKTGENDPLVRKKLSSKDQGVKAGSARPEKLRRLARRKPQDSRCQGQRRQSFKSGGR